MRSTQGFVQIIIAVIIALVIGTGAMFAYQKYSQKYNPSPAQSPSNNNQTQIINKTSPPPAVSDETVYPDSIGANWKTYTNAKQKYSVKYPEDLEVFLEESTETSLKSKTTYLLLGILVDQKDLAYEDYSKMKIYDTIAGINPITRLPNIQVNDTDALVVKQNLENTKSIYFEANFKKGANYYLIKIEGDVSNEKKLLNLFNQILSTFKFTN